MPYPFNILQPLICIAITISPYQLKLSPEAIIIVQAFEALLSSINDIEPLAHDYSLPCYRRWLHADLPRDRDWSNILIIPPQFDPMVHNFTFDNKCIYPHQIGSV
jgi:hypothetical protein